MRAAPNGTRNRALGDVIRNQLPGSPCGHSFESFRLEAEQQTHRASSKMHEESEREGGRREAEKPLQGIERGGRGEGGGVLACTGREMPRSLVKP